MEKNGDGWIPLYSSELLIATNKMDSGSVGKKKITGN